MGQVPSIKYGIVGDGRMARHMKHYLELLGAPVRQWSRKISTECGSKAEDRLGDCDVILILISDGAIDSFVENHHFLKSKKVLHFSGSLISPNCSGFHPLMTFGPELYDLTSYQNIAFICETPGPVFSDIFPILSNPNYSIHRDLKPFYHSLCVLAGNFTVMLWQKLFSELPATLEIPASAGLPYLHRVVENLKANPQAALTGPIQRGDVKTISANLKSLEGDPFQKVYQAFVQAAAESAKKGVKQ